MPKFHPTPIIQDCWSSIGNITFYHRNGQCFYKRKIKPVFPGTPAQLDQAQVHHRAILAWQQLPHAVQLQWRELAKSVPSHRPPYDDNHHISGYNLFVSAYHGFAQAWPQTRPGTTAISAVPNLASPAAADRFRGLIRIRISALPSHSPEHRQSRPLARISQDTVHRPGRGL